MKRNQVTEVPSFQVLESSVLAAARLNRVPTWEEISSDYKLVAPYVRHTSSGKIESKVRKTGQQRLTIRDLINWKVPYRGRIGEPTGLDRDRPLSVVLADVPRAEMGVNYTPVFPSYSSLLRHIVEGRVSLDMLRRGLFCFGCTEVHVTDLLKVYKVPTDPDRDSSRNERTWLDAPPQVQALVQAVIIGASMVAEEEGRLLWRKLEERTDYNFVNQLLSANGFKVLKTPRYESYSYPALRDFVNASGQYLRVIW